MPRFVWPKHTYTNGPGTGNGGSPTNAPLLSVLPGAPTTAQIANPAGLTDAKGNAVTCSRATANYARKSLVFDAANLTPAPERVGDTTGGAWAPQGSTAGPTITLNTLDFAAPDGTYSASRLDFPAVSSGYSICRTTPTFSSAVATHQFSVYLRCASGTATTYIGGGNVGGDFVTVCNLTTTWQRFTATFTGFTATNIDIGTNSGNYTSTPPEAPTPAQTIYAWGAKAEQAASATAYVSPMLVSIPANTARVEPEGLLVEGASTNLLQYSQDFTQTVWTKNGVLVAAPVITANSVIAPDSTLTGNTIALPSVVAAGAASVVSQGFTATAALYTFSIWLMAPTGGNKTIYLTFTNNATIPTQYLGTTSCTVTPGQWTRFTITATLTAATWYVQAGVDLRDGAQLTQASQSVYAWGAQAELGPGATSYIPTTTATVARSGETWTGATTTLTKVQGRAVISIRPYLGGAPNAGSVALQPTEGNQYTFYWNGGDSNMHDYDFVTANTVTANFTAGTAKTYQNTWSATGRTLANVADALSASTGANAGTAISSYTPNGNAGANSGYWVTNLALYKK